MANFDFLKGNIETIILNSLFTGDKYGYEIAKEIKEKTENQYEIKQATLYAYLKRLEQRDLVKSYWGAESHGGRRRYFALSELGKTSCKKFAAEWNFHKNILENLVADEIDSDENFADDLEIGRDKFFGSKTPRQQRSKNIKSDTDNNKIADELEKIKQAQRLSDAGSDEQKQDAFFYSDDNLWDLFSQDPYKTENLQQAEKAIEESSFSSSNNASSAANLNSNLRADTKYFDDKYGKFDRKEIETFRPEFSNIERPAEGQKNQFNKIPSATDNNYGSQSIFSKNFEPIIQNKTEGIFEQRFEHDNFAIQKDTTLNNADKHEEPLEKPAGKKQPEPLPRIPNTSPAFDPDALANLKKKTHASPKDNEQTSQFASEQQVPVNSYSKKEETDSRHYRSAMRELLGDQITDTDAKIGSYSSHKEQLNEINDSGNIVELADEFAKGGLKMRFYNASVSQYRAVPMLLKSKINCAVSWMTAGIFSILLLFLAVLNDAGYSAFALFSALFLVVPFYFTTMYLIRPHLQVKPKKKNAYVLVNRLIYFITGTLLIVSIDFIILKTNFQNFEEAFKEFFIPVFALAMLPLSELIYKCFLNLKMFYN